MNEQLAITLAIRSACRFIARACKEGDPTDPKMVEAVSHAVKVLADIQMSKRVMEARLATTANADKC